MDWYYKLAIGAFVAFYVSNGTVRHIVNSILVGVLKALVWVFQRTDGQGKPAGQGDNQPDENDSDDDNEDAFLPKNGIQISRRDFAKFNMNNPDVTIEER